MSDDGLNSEIESSIIEEEEEEEFGSEEEEKEEEIADTRKIISKLWLLSKKTENIELLIDQFETLWTPEEKLFLLNLHDRSLKCHAFFSKIIKRDDPLDRTKLMKALRFSTNNFIADEIAHLDSPETGSKDSKDDSEEGDEKLVKTGDNEDDDDETHKNKSDIMTASFTSIHLEEQTIKKGKSNPVQITYEISGLTKPKKSVLSFGFQALHDIGRILEPRGIFISESFQHRITVLKLSDFIINQNHLVLALSPCESIQILDLQNIYFEHHKSIGSLIGSNSNTSNSSSGVISSTKLWLPKLTKFSFIHNCDREKTSANNLVYINESYSWDQIFFFETNKGNPSHLRNLWQSQSIEVAVKTVSMELVISQSVDRPSVSFSLYKVQSSNGQPVIPDYFLDSFLRNCRRLKYLNVVLPPEMAAGGIKVDFDCLPQELEELSLVGFVVTGAFTMMKPIKKLFMAHCTLPEIFLSELNGVVPLSTSIRLISCTHEKLGISINVKIVSTSQESSTSTE